MYRIICQKALILCSIFRCLITWWIGSVWILKVPAKHSVTLPYISKSFTLLANNVYLTLMISLSCALRCPIWLNFISFYCTRYILQIYNCLFSRFSLIRSYYNLKCANSSLRTLWQLDRILNILSLATKFTPLQAPRKVDTHIS